MDHNYDSGRARCGSSTPGRNWVFPMNGPTRPTCRLIRTASRGWVGCPGSTPASPCTPSPSTWPTSSEGGPRAKSPGRSPWRWQARRRSSFCLEPVLLRKKFRRGALRECHRLGAQAGRDPGTRDKGLATVCSGSINAPADAGR